MEKKDLLPSYSEAEGGNDQSSIGLIQRRQAIHSFLNNPAATLQQYPELGDDLIAFFSQNVNPHLNDATGEPARGREEDFEKWKIAQEWARLHLKSAFPSADDQF